MVLIEVLKNLFRKPFTRRYPKEKPELPEGFRGPVEWNKKTCIFCGICAKNCPAFAIKINKNKRKLTVDEYKCITCGVCEENCPTSPKSIYLTKNLHESKTSG